MNRRPSVSRLKLAPLEREAQSTAQEPPAAARVPSRIPVLKSRAISAGKLRPVSRELPPLQQRPAGTFTARTEASEDLDVLTFMERMKEADQTNSVHHAPMSALNSKKLGMASPFSTSPFSQLDTATVAHHGASRPSSRLSALSDTVATHRSDYISKPPMQNSFSIPLRSPSPSMAPSVGGEEAFPALPEPVMSPTRYGSHLYEVASPSKPRYEPATPKSSRKAGNFTSSARRRSAPMTETPMRMNSNDATAMSPSARTPGLRTPATHVTQRMAGNTTQPASGARRALLSPPRSPLLSPALSALRASEVVGADAFGVDKSATPHLPNESNAGMETTAEALAALDDEQMDLIKQILKLQYGIDWTPRLLEDLPEEDHQVYDDVSGSYFQLNEREQWQLHNDIATGRIQQQPQGNWKEARDWLRRSLAGPHLRSSVSMRDSMLFPSVKPQLRISQESATLLQTRAAATPGPVSSPTPLNRTRMTAATDDDAMPPPRAATPHVDDSIRVHANNSSVEDSLINTSTLNRSSTLLLPSSGFRHGTVLALELWDNWGDPNFIGLTGLEIFDSNGELVKADNIASLQRLDASGNLVDEPELWRLFDGVNVTKDENHMWRTPLSDSDAPTTLLIAFKEHIGLAMVRIYNYNQDRIHASRGVKQLLISLDREVLFHGDIRRAAGVIPDSMRMSTMASPENFLSPVKLVQSLAETIALTGDPTVLQAISRNDPLCMLLDRVNAETSAEAFTMSSASMLHATIRPRTTENNTTMSQGRRLSFTAVDRTLASMALPEEDEENLDDLLNELGIRDGSKLNRTQEAVDNTIESLHNTINAERAVTDADSSFIPLSSCPFGQRMQLDLLSNFGDSDYIGLTGVEVYVLQPVSRTHGVSVQLPLSPAMLSANPRDINVNGHSGDPRTLDKLVDGYNVTQNDVHMWLIPFDATPDILVASSGYERGRHTVSLDFSQPYHIHSIKIYNYNQSTDAVARGVRHFCMSIDDTPVQNAFLSSQLGIGYDVLQLRRAPGTDWYDFGQVFPLSAVEHDGFVSYFATASSEASLEPMQSGGKLAVMQDHDCAFLPTGQTIKFVFHSSCGDPFYVGLDALALYDAAGRRIPVAAERIHALPASINDVEPDSQDIRIPQNLAFEPRSEPATVDPECKARNDDPRLYHPGRLPPHSTWLSAFLPTPVGCGTRPSIMLVMLLQEPTSISFLRVVNYSKDPERGVGAFDMYVDDVLVFSGELEPNSNATTAKPVEKSTAILFHKDKKFAEAVLRYSKPCFSGSHEQDVLCFHNGALVPHVSSKRATQRASYLQRRGKAAATVPLQRPKTALTN